MTPTAHLKLQPAVPNAPCLRHFRGDAHHGEPGCPDCERLAQALARKPIKLFTTIATFLAGSKQ